MQRYDLTYDDIEEFKDGDYILYSDHLAEIEKLKLRLMEFHTMSTVEMMCENENVRHHVTEWENRCLKAEADLAESQERVRELEAELKGCEGDYKFEYEKRHALEARIKELEEMINNSGGYKDLVDMLRHSETTLKERNRTLTEALEQLADDKGSAYWTSEEERNIAKQALGCGE